jgi:2-keto-3-deoxy-L-fuconate dehydrogenase
VPPPKPSGRCNGTRVLVTSSDIYMGPAIVERFRAEGGSVVEDFGRYVDDPNEPARVVAAMGRVDVLVLNLLASPPKQFAHEIVEEAWQSAFDALVHPTMRFVAAVLPQMIERRSGKIVAVTSAAPLRSIPGRGAYSAARGAQNAFVEVAGAESAQHNVQINAIAQNYVYGGYPPDALENPRVRDELSRDVPTRRLAESWEQAELVLFLASQSSDFISGQVVPFAGGWVTST